MLEESLSGDEHSSFNALSFETKENMNFTQTSLRRYVTYHSKFRFLDKMSTTPRSSKLQNNRRRLPFSNIINVSSASGTDSNHNENCSKRIRKRCSSSFFEVDSPIKMNNVIIVNEDIVNSCKRRRCDAYILEKEHQHSTTIFSALSSLTTVTKTFNDSTSSDDFSHYTLPVVSRPQIENCAFASICSSTLADFLASMTPEEFHLQFFLVDCRYPFEYDGGHIMNAVNIYDPLCIKDVFFPKDDGLFFKVNSRIPILYCEYSQKRSVSMAMELRRQDRHKNVYPCLDYKEVYILDYGYRKFFAEDNHTDLCTPSAYVSMIDENFADELKRFRHHKKKVATKQTSCIELRTIERRREKRRELSNQFSESSKLTDASSFKSLSTLLHQTKVSSNFELNSSFERNVGEVCSRLSMVSQLESCLSRVNLDMSLK